VQEVMDPLVLSLLLLVASWSVSVLSVYLLAYEAIGTRKKPWSMMADEEQWWVLWFSGLGCSVGVVCFLILLAAARWAGTFPQLDFVVLLVGVSVGMLLTALAGVMATRRKVSEGPLKEYALLHEPQDRPTDNKGN